MARTRLYQVEVWPVIHKCKQKGREQSQQPPRSPRKCPLPHQRPARHLQCWQVQNPLALQRPDSPSALAARDTTAASELLPGRTASTSRTWQRKALRQGLFNNFGIMFSLSQIMADIFST